MPGVKVDELVYGRIRALSEAEDRPMATVIRRALDCYERDVAKVSTRARLDALLDAPDEAAEVEKVAARTRARVEADAAIAEVKRGHAQAGPVADIAEQLERVTQQKGKGTSVPQQESRSSGRVVKKAGVPVKPEKPCEHPKNRRENTGSGFARCGQCGERMP